MSEDGGKTLSSFHAFLSSLSGHRPPKHNIPPPSEEEKQDEHETGNMKHPKLTLIRWQFDNHHHSIHFITDWPSLQHSSPFLSACESTQPLDRLCNYFLQRYARPKYILAEEVPGGGGGL